MINIRDAAYMMELQINLIQKEIDKILDAIESKIKDGHFNSCTLNKNIIDFGYYDMIASILVLKGFDVMLVGDEIKISWKENCN